MGDGQLNDVVFPRPLYVGCPNAASPPWHKPHPAIDESSRIIIGQCAALARCSGNWARKQIGLDQNLEPVADPDNRTARFDKTLQNIVQMVHDLIGQNFSRRNIVPIAESAGDGQDLKIVQERRLPYELIDVDSFSKGTGQRKGMGGLFVAIGSRAPQDQRAWLHAVDSIDGGAFAVAMLDR